MARRARQAVAEVWLDGADLAQGKLDATLLMIKLQEDPGLAIVCAGAMARRRSGSANFFGLKDAMGVCRAGGRRR